MFTNIDDNQRKFGEFLKTEEGRKVIEGFVKGPIPDYYSMFRKFYIEYGMELCKCHEEPMDDVNEEKCSEYERFLE